VCLKEEIGGGMRKGEAKRGNKEENMPSVGKLR
jgi:hypothetical protein